MTDPAKIAAVLSEAQVMWLLSTPDMFPNLAKTIAGLGARRFAMFAWRNPSLFQRINDHSDSRWSYRLTPLGLQVRRELEKEKNDV